MKRLLALFSLLNPAREEVTRRIARARRPIAFGWWGFYVVALAVASAQTVTPILQPHQSFLDSNGLPCSLCSLYSYVGGTSTPQPTFTDSTGNTQNPNPLPLDATGSATIWVSNTLTYKFVLIDADGATVFSVDNVKASGGSVPCTTPYAVQFANSSATALACDSTITINPTSHTLMVGGAITGNSFTLKNLGTITTSWTLDVTSPTTALNSLGAIPLANLATQAQDSVVMNIAATGPPTAVPLPAGCTNGVNYSTSTHSWTCASAVVPLTALASQGPNTVVMNATGSTGPPTAVAMPTGCTTGVNYSTITNAWTCNPSNVYNPSDHDVSLSRSFGTTYQNTSAGPMRLYGYGTTTGSSVGSTQVLIGASSPTSPTYGNTCSGTVSGGACGFTGEVPSGWFYTVASNTLSGGSNAVTGVGHWHEVY